MNELKKIISGAYRITRSFRNRKKVRILMYHSIGTPVPDDFAGNYNLDFKSFIRHLDCLEEYNIPCIPLSDVLNFESGIAITFDDGYSNNLDKAAPLLTERKIPFTVFATPKFILEDSSCYMSVNELKTLSSLPGVTIGAHGFSHCRLAECSREELYHELSGSKKWLEDLLGKKVDTMSYPHGSVNEKVIECAGQVGFQIACSSKFGAIGKVYNSLCLNRTDIWASDDESIFLSKLTGDFDWLGWI